MDDVSYEEFNRGKNNLLFIVVFSLILLGVVLGIFTTFKQETLVCDKSKDLCYVQKTNIAGLKYKKKLIKMSNISNVSFMPQKVTGNRYAKGYTSYFLTFIDRANNPIIIFSTDYYEKSEVDMAIKYLKKQITDNKTEIKLDRN